MIMIMIMMMTITLKHHTFLSHVGNIDNFYSKRFVRFSVNAFMNYSKSSPVTEENITKYSLYFVQKHHENIENSRPSL